MPFVLQCCSTCESGFFAALGSEDCVAWTVKGTLACGNTDTAGSTSRYTAGSATVDSSCAPCNKGSTFGANDATNCAAVTTPTCGKTTISGSTTRATVSSTTADNSCEDCAVGTFAALPTENCAPVTTPTCGKTTLSGDTARASIAATTTTDNSCAACAAGYVAAAITDNCQCQTNCTLPTSSSSHGTPDCTELDTVGKLIHGKTCNTLKCDVNYVPSGSLTCTCGVMTPSDLKCVPKPTASDFCSDAYPKIVNGGVGDCKAGANSGTTCTPTCKTGYEIDGNGLCQSDGTWAKFACRLPEISSGAIFVRISKWTTTDCSGTPYDNPIEQQECRCRGDVCQRMTCEANGNYVVSSYSLANCFGTQKDQIRIVSGAKSDIIKFGECQVSEHGTDESTSNMIQCMGVDPTTGEVVPLNGPGAVRIGTLNNGGKMGFSTMMLVVVLVVVGLLC